MTLRIACALAAPLLALPLFRAQDTPAPEVETAEVETAKLETAKLETAKLETAKLEAAKLEAAEPRTMELETLPQKPAFEWVSDWLQLPEGLSLGNTHGCMVVSEAGEIYVNTDSENAIIVLRPDGTLVKKWGKQLAGGLHGMTIVKEGDEEFLYISHLVRHEVLKTTLDGEVLWTMGYPASSGHYKDASQYKPTGVAVGPDGSIYVADGYGQNWVHQFDSERNYVRSFGGRGDEPGKFQTCHGIWLDTRGEEPVLLVSDRENHRLQTFDLEGRALEVFTPGLRRPCSVYEHDGLLAVADLAGRISLLDEDNKLIAHLCDNPDPKKRAVNGVPREQWADGEFIAPHSVCFDKDGNLYVMDWNSLGRITKLRRLR